MDEIIKQHRTQESMHMNQGPQPPVVRDEKLIVLWIRIYKNRTCCINNMFLYNCHSRIKNIQTYFFPLLLSGILRFF
jgi:hypothetical protein